jgi:hypothetical protein
MVLRTGAPFDETVVRFGRAERLADDHAKAVKHVTESHTDGSKRHAKQAPR